MDYKCWWFGNPKQPLGMYKICRNNGINYQPQPVNLPDFWNHQQVVPLFCPTSQPSNSHPLLVLFAPNLFPSKGKWCFLLLFCFTHYLWICGRLHIGSAQALTMANNGVQEGKNRVARGGHGLHFIYTVVKPKTLENLPTISKILVWVCYQRSTFLPHTTGTHNSTAPCKHLSFTTKFDRIPSCVHVVWKWKVSRGVKLILDFFYICVFLLFFHALRFATCPSRFPHVFTMQPQSWRWM